MVGLTSASALPIERRIKERLSASVIFSLYVMIPQCLWSLHNTLSRLRTFGLPTRDIEVKVDGIQYQEALARLADYTEEPQGQELQYYLEQEGGTIAPVRVTERAF